MIRNCGVERGKIIARRRDPRAIDPTSNPPSPAFNPYYVWLSREKLVRRNPARQLLFRRSYEAAIRSDFMIKSTNVHVPRINAENPMNVIMFLSSCTALLPSHFDPFADYLSNILLRHGISYQDVCVELTV